MTARPRIVCFAPFPPPVNGQSVITETFCDALAAAADVERVDTADHNAAWRRPGTVPAERVRLWARNLARFGVRVRSAPAASVYLTPASSHLGLLRDAAALALVPRGTRVVAHVHTGDYGRILTDPAGGRLARRVAARFARILVPSEFAAAGVRAALPGARVIVVPNPVPADMRRTDAEVEQALRARDGATPHVVFLSNMIRAKGYRVLADAAARLAASGEAFRLTFAGEWLHDADRHAFEAELGALGLTDRVAVAGPLGRAAVRRLLAETDVLAFPSALPEAFGLVMTEAMEAGCAVVATGHAAAPEIVRDGTDGRLVAPDDPAALAAALADALANRAAYGRAGRARVTSAFEPDGIERAFVAAVLGHDSPQAPVPALSSDAPRAAP